MKNLINICLIILCFNSIIISNDKINKENKMDTRAYDIFNSKESLNISEFNKNCDEKLLKYEYKLDENITIIQDKWDDYYDEGVLIKNSIYFIDKDYYINGNIKESRLRYNLGGVDSKLKRYSMNGELIESIDYDIPYTFTYLDVIDFIKNCDYDIDLNEHRTMIRRIEFYNIFDYIKECGYHDGVYKKNNILNNTQFDYSKKNAWIIEWYNMKDYPEQMQIIILNGKTGKILEKTYYDYLNN